MSLYLNLVYKRNKLAIRLLSLSMISVILQTWGSFSAHISFTAAVMFNYHLSELKWMVLIRGYNLVYSNIHIFPICLLFNSKWFSSPFIHHWHFYYMRSKVCPQFCKSRVLCILIFQWKSIGQTIAFWSDQTLSDQPLYSANISNLSWYSVKNLI